MLFRCGLPFQRGADPDTAMMAYVGSLAGITRDAIAAGIAKFLRGDVEGVSVKFVPTPPELARIVRSAVVQNRIPPSHQISAKPPMMSDERARMKLKMALFKAGQGSQGRTQELQKALVSFEDAIALAQEWGVTVPEDVWEEFNSAGSDDRWRKAKARALREMERNPPPFMRGRRPNQFEDAA